MGRKRFRRPLQSPDGHLQVPPRQVQINVDPVEEAALLDGHDLNLVEEIVEMEGVGEDGGYFVGPLLEHRLLGLIQHDCILRLLWSRHSRVWYCWYWPRVC